MSTPSPFGTIASALTPPSPGAAARTIFQLAYQVTPIILTGGIATNLGGALPIVALTEGVNFIQGLLSGLPVDPNDFFANYMPLAGASLINNQIGMYPFANQSVAANAIIAQPLNISMGMSCPASPASGGFPLKLVTMMALQNSLAQHNSLGGTYSIITASYIYTNCIMTGMRDVSGGESRQPQYQWQLDFVQPLVTIAAAQTAQNSLMAAFNGTPPSVQPGLTIAGLAVANPATLLATSLVPPSSAVSAAPPALQ